MKILLAYVPSRTSEAALEYAVRRCHDSSAQLLVLASEKSTPKKAADVLDQRPLAERIAERGLEADLRTVPRRDDPADDILATAEQEQVDEIVLGIRHRTPIGKIILGSTSLRVIMEAPCPVVCVKPGQVTS